MDIETVIVGGGHVASLVILQPRERDKKDANRRLPIKIGLVEATAISTGIEAVSESDPHRPSRPMTHDLLVSTIHTLGYELTAVCIVAVEGDTFFARLELTSEDGAVTSVDARPSDALACALRVHAPIFATTEVLDIATMPDFEGAERELRESELAEFHSFVEDLKPEDFTTHD